MDESRKPDEISEINSRQDLVRFVYGLLNNLDQHPEEWDNKDLRYYLRALAAFLNDADGYYKHAHLKESADTPSWQLFAHCLRAASCYD